MSPKSRFAYMAGLMDGEGSFSISITDEGKHFAANIRLYNTNEKLIKWVIENFGGTPSWNKRNGSNLKDSEKEYKDMCQWFITGRKAMEKFLLAIIPYLIGKREQAELLLEYIRMNGKHDPVKRKQLADRISFLNTGTPTTNTQE
jgi:hypothetical protein